METNEEKYYKDDDDDDDRWGRSEVSTSAK